MKRSPVVWLIAGLLIPFLILFNSHCLLAQAVDAGDLTPIYEIQGSGSASPLLTEWVDTAGLVTGVTGNGYYLQDVAGDGDETTSDGIFVYTQRKPTVAVGDCLLLNRAYVDEYYDKTELSRTKSPVAVDWCDHMSIEPVRLSAARLASDPAATFERYEGMLVMVDDLAGLVQGPTKRFNNGDAEIAFIPETLEAYIDGGRVFQHQAQDKSALMYVSSALGPELPDLHWGDHIVLGPEAGSEDGVLGILGYNFGKYQFMPLPGQLVRAESKQPGPDELPEVAARSAGASDFTVCTFNLLGLGSGTAQYKDETEYADQLHKRALAIAERLGGCTVIAAQEAGEPKDAENLAALLSNAFNLDYEATAIEGPGTSSFEFPLTNALLTRSDRVIVLDATLRQGCSRFNYDVKYEPGVCERGTYGLFNRPPLVVELAIQVGSDDMGNGDMGNGDMGNGDMGNGDMGNGEPYYLTVIDNHWKSKGGDETVNVVRRQAQAEHVASLVQETLDADPAANVVVLGDLNDYYRSGPVEALRTGVDPDLVHAYDFLPDLNRYTYIFNGASQVLDHVLFTPGMTEHLAEVRPMRLNANYAYPLTLNADSVQHSSDHDPVLVRFRPAGAALLGDNLGFGDIDVSLVDKNGNIAATTRTDDNGDFRLWDLTPGEYMLALTPPPAIQIEPMELPLEIESGQNSTPKVDVQHEGIELGAAVALNPLLR